MKRRDGFAIGLLVFGGLAFLTVAIFPTLLFSGSQTRSEALSKKRWRARAAATSGLKAAANLLRTRRWWNTAASDLRSVGVKTSADLGVDESLGSFRVVAEALTDPTMATWIPQTTGPNRPSLERIDLFAVGTSGGDSVVAFGTFVMAPTPLFVGRSTNSALGGATTKRLARITFFPEPEFRDVDDPAVRKAIRDRLKSIAPDFLANYAAVDWKAAPPSPLATGLSDTAADAYLARFRGTDPPGYEPKADFLRDRIYDVVFEGTPASERGSAIWERRIYPNLGACPAADFQALGKFLCDNVSGCSWEVPASCTPEKWTFEPEDPGGKTAQQLLEEEVGAVPNSGYVAAMIETPPIVRDYDFGCGSFYYLPPPRPPPGPGDPPNPPEPSPPSGALLFPSGLAPAGAPSGPGETYCVGARASVSAPTQSVPYYLEDPTTGFNAPLSEVFQFYRRQLLDRGVPPAEAITGGQITVDQFNPPPPRPPGSGGGSSSGSGGGGFSGGGSF